MLKIKFYKVIDDLYILFCFPFRCILFKKLIYIKYFRSNIKICLKLLKFGEGKTFFVLKELKN